MGPCTPRLIHNTYDVFVQLDGNEIIDVKLEKREQSGVMTEMVIEDDGLTIRWLHPTDNNFVFAGVINAPLAWISEKTFCKM
jgi:hypothetical protein